jgi:sugar diacid utilization regulator
MGGSYLHLLFDTALLPASSGGIPLRGSEVRTNREDLFGVGGDSVEVQAIIDDLARTIGRPITLEDAGGRLVAYSAHDQPVDSVRVETLLRRGASEATLKALKERGVYASVERNPGVAFVNGIPEIGFSPRVALAIKVGNTVLGYLWVINGQVPLTAQAEEALLRARQQLIQALERRGATQDLRQKQREDIIADLVRGGQRDMDGLQSALKAIGWYGEPPFEVMLVRDRRGDRSQQVFKETDPLLREAAPASLRGIFRDDVVVILAGADTQGAAQVARAIADRYSRMGRDVAVGLGGPCEELSLLKRSYSEASEAISLGARFRFQSGFFDYRALAPYDLLSCLAGCKNHSTFGRDAVSKLITYDELHKSQLFDTLETYLDLYGRRKMAAERLNIHPNTLDYRIRKVKELTGMDPDDPDSRLILHVWTKALHFARDTALGET